MKGDVVSRTSQESQFLEVIFGDVLETDETLRILIWTRPGRNRTSDSVFFNSTLAAGDFSRQFREKRDIYFGLGLRKEGLADGRRGKESEVIGIPAFCMDFDVASEGAEGKNVFEDRSEVEELLRSLRNQPTVAVLSGHGIHAYWKLDEPWIFESQDEWDSARRMSLGWFRHVKSQTERVIDSTYTLDRVWRIPGTYNHKTEPPSMVEILFHDDFRTYDPEDDFGMFAATKEQISTLGGMNEGRIKLTIDRQASTPEVAKSLVVASEDFAKLWHQVRKMKSQSEYDMAIACAGREAGWTVAETLAAVVANRRMKSGDMKYGNDGYYSLTLTKVFGCKIEPNEEKKEESAIRNFSKVVGLPIKEIAKYGSSAMGQRGIVFYVELKNGAEISIGSIVDFRKQSLWRDIRAINNPEGIGETVKKVAFDNLVDAVMKVAKDRSMADEDVYTGFLISLDNYFVSVGTVDLGGKTDREKSPFTRQGAPFIENGRVWFTRTGFLKWVKDNGEDLNPIGLTQLLRKAGIKRAAIATYLDDDKQSSRSYYQIRRDHLNKKLRTMLVLKKEEKESD